MERRYHWVVRLSASSKGHDCEAFLNYVSKWANEGRTMIEWTKLADGSDCAASVRFCCPSMGRNGPNRLFKTVISKYPDADITQQRE